MTIVSIVYSHNADFTDVIAIFPCSFVKYYKKFLLPVTVRFLCYCFYLGFFTMHECNYPLKYSRKVGHDAGQELTCRDAVFKNM